ALERAGKDLGTPIITFRPGLSNEASFFGPVISTIPRGDAALQLWDAVEILASTSCMAELKRSNRGKPVFD
ncbi:MAG: mycothiol-dependent nitroreductase Rv2466c family protein, partial [Ilumatobacteraceae bacterium]